MFACTSRLLLVTLKEEEFVGVSGSVGKHNFCFSVLWGRIIASRLLLPLLWSEVGGGRGSQGPHTLHRPDVHSKSPF